MWLQGQARGSQLSWASVPWDPVEAQSHSFLQAQIPVSRAVQGRWPDGPGVPPTVLAEVSEPSRKPLSEGGLPGRDSGPGPVVSWGGSFSSPLSLGSVFNLQGPCKPPAS